MSINLDAVLQTFFIESRELLEDMEECLLKMESDLRNQELIDAIFRAAHTIKGSAGLFGFDEIVSFTHVVEDMLDRLRGGSLCMNERKIALLLSCRDHIARLVEAAGTDGESTAEDLNSNGASLLEQLKEISDFGGDLPDSCGVSTSQPAAIINTGSVADEAVSWRISVVFGREVFRFGMDPVSFVNALTRKGEVTRVDSRVVDMPALEEFDPEDCYWAADIQLRTLCSKEDILETFDFIADCSVINVTQAFAVEQSKPQEYLVSDLICGEDVAASAQVDPATSSQSPQPASLMKNMLSGSVGSKDSQYVRVHAEKLDSLINLVGELVIAGAGASLLAKSCKNDLLFEATSSISSLVEHIRDGALKLRMIPIGDTFNRYQRVVRDVSKELGKQIELKISGGETELDKTVIEKIGDPLMHLIRNAMDHGIESPQERQDARKPVKGSVHLNAYHESGNIVIEITDDGRGLDKDRIVSKALEKGLISAPPGSDQEIFNLIFEPGFSTASTITNISGRGVGMDVVRRNIDALRGSIELDSKMAEGTTVRIRLPLTLAIIDGFLVAVGKSRYVIPLDMVQECIELSDSQFSATKGKQYLDLRGEVLPLIFLREHFSVKEGVSKRANVVVINTGDRKFGLVVDELQGEFQTVIKPLGKLFSVVKGIAGSTILGDGSVALILDAVSLTKDIHRPDKKINSDLAVPQMV